MNGVYVYRHRAGFLGVLGRVQPLSHHWALRSKLALGKSCYKSIREQRDLTWIEQNENTNNCICVCVRAVSCVVACLVTPWHT
jgi:hypothetical protein